MKVEFKAMKYAGEPTHEERTHPAAVTNAQRKRNSGP